MAYCRTSAGAAETTVCDKSNASVKSFADNCRSRCEHFGHTGTALGTFITDNHHISGDYYVVHNSVYRSLLAVKYLCRTREVHHLGLNRTLLYYRAVLGKIAA